MTSLHFKFNTKIKHPEEMAARVNLQITGYRPDEFDVQANAQERHDIQALIDDLNQNNQYDVTVDCLPVALTDDSRHTVIMNIYDLNLSTSQIQAIIKKHYQIVTEGKTPTVKLNDEHAELRIEITA